MTNTTAQAEEIKVADFFVVDTPSAMAHTSQTCSCCCCGRKIKNVFVATDGRYWGGDCLATISGDDSTRVAYRNAEKALQRRLYNFNYAIARPFGGGIEISSKNNNRRDVVDIRCKASDKRRVIGKALAINNGLNWTE